MGRIAVVISFIVVIFIVVAAGGYWYVKDHQRISLASVQDKVAATQNADGVICVQKTAHGKHWNCAGKVNSKGQCFNVTVSWRGDATIKAVGDRRCASDSALKPILAAS
jgi:hypothetical protein